MRNRCFWAVTLICLSAATLASAQELPKAELFVGYSYLQANTSSTGFNLSGWEASVTVNANRWLGLETDFSGHYGDVEFVARSHAPRLTFLLGPRLSYRATPRITPFVHLLAGGAYGTSKSISSTIPCPPFPCGSPVTVSETVLSTAVGGGIDFQATRRVAVRLIQADWNWTRFTLDRQNDPRISAGLVFTFGRR